MREPSEKYEKKFAEIEPAPVFVFDDVTKELKISVPYIPEILSVTLWNLPDRKGGGGTVPKPPKQQGDPVMSGGTGGKPPKKVLVQSKDAEDDVWPRADS